TVYHEFAGEHASMGARLLSVVPVMRLEGPDARRAETVTVMNDLCILAAGALVHPSFAWEPIDAVSARARYTAPPYTVASTLRFSERGELIDFVSDDRLEATPEGLVPRRWSTPLRDYRAFGPLSAASRGEGRWHGGDGGYSYIELELLELEVD
ncbi:MAG TPA: DUF6544 family protein, partial [Longimicrobiales bacterium]|nr:DUF6544 family protein [Longimicrobiales bacterium]